jgi:hypothetical protein
VVPTRKRFGGAKLIEGGAFHDTHHVFIPLLDELNQNSGGEAD